jgi:hypothetical protein
LEGQVILLPSWRAFKDGGVNLYFMESVWCVEEIKMVTLVVMKLGCVVSTMENMISIHRIYLKIWKYDGIVRDGGMNV